MKPSIILARLNSFESRFNKRVNRNGPMPDPIKYPTLKTNCWLWTGGVDNTGYGKVYGSIKSRGAHRIAYELSFGKIPSGMLVCHRCDNKLCVRPDHLFTGTYQDNVDDCIKKNRHAVGEKNGLVKNPERAARGEASGTSKLTEQQVREIRKLHKSGGLYYCQIANKFGIGTMTVWRIVHRKNWRHVV